MNQPGSKKNKKSVEDDSVASHLHRLLQSSNACPMRRSWDLRSAPRRRTPAMRALRRPIHTPTKLIPMAPGVGFSDRFWPESLRLWSVPTENSPDFGGRRRRGWRWRAHRSIGMTGPRRCRWGWTGARLRGSGWVWRLWSMWGFWVVWWCCREIDWKVFLCFLCGIVGELCVWELEWVIYLMVFEVVGAML